jgi:hypothetical protein
LESGDDIVGLLEEATLPTAHLASNNAYYDEMRTSRNCSRTRMTSRSR